MIQMTPVVASLLKNEHAHNKNQSHWCVIVYTLPCMFYMLIALREPRGNDPSGIVLQNQMDSFFDAHNHLMW